VHADRGVNPLPPAGPAHHHSISQASSQVSMVQASPHHLPPQGFYHAPPQAAFPHVRMDVPPAGLGLAPGQEENYDQDTPAEYANDL
jgi:hypothetical protein